MRGILVTGTDTEIGKTFIAAGLLRALRANGLDAVPAKPVQTGVEPSPTGSPSGDLTFSLKAARLTPSPDEIRLMCPYTYEPACSPELAGRMSGSLPSMDVIADSLQTLAERHDALVVEGAGGVLVPLDDKHTYLDLMKRLELPVLLVARRSLGTINHTLLSLDVLRAAGLRPVGVVLNQSSPGEADFVALDNPRAITAFGKVPILGNIDFIPSAPNPEDPQTWETFEQGMTGIDVILEEL